MFAVVTRQRRSQIAKRPKARGWCRARTSLGRIDAESHRWAPPAIVRTCSTGTVWMSSRSAACSVNVTRGNHVGATSSRSHRFLDVVLVGYRPPAQPPRIKDHADQHSIATWMRLMASPPIWERRPRREVTQLLGRKSGSGSNPNRRYRAGKTNRATIVETTTPRASPSTIGRTISRPATVPKNRIGRIAHCRSDGGRHDRRQQFPGPLMTNRGRRSRPHGPPDSDTS